MIKKLLLSAAFMVVGGVALAAGLYQGLPLISQASYCGTTENLTNCASPIPAGPVSLTGNEIVGLDTLLPQGIQPQTAGASIRILNAGPYQYNAPLTGASVTVLNTSRRLILEPAGTIAALTVVFPAATSLLDNQTFGLCSRQTVTALTITNGTGATVLDAPTAITGTAAGVNATNCYEWSYRVANTSWYRVQ